MVGMLYRLGFVLRFRKSDWTEILCEKGKDAGYVGEINARGGMFMYGWNESVCMAT